MSMFCSKHQEPNDNVFPTAVGCFLAALKRQCFSYVHTSVKKLNATDKITFTSAICEVPNPVFIH